MKLITKGTWYYEIQILMFVFMWRHADYNPKNYPLSSTRGFRWGRLVIWFDTAWSTHADLINIKRIFRRWIGNNKTFRALKSIRAYFQLHKAGFRISNGPNQDNSFDIYRFYWKDKVIKDMCDIDRVNKNYYTVRAGHSEALGVQIWEEEYKKFTTNSDDHDI